jgi:hypothetical protein
MDLLIEDPYLAWITIEIVNCEGSNFLTKERDVANKRCSPRQEDLNGRELEGGQYYLHRENSSGFEG